MELQLPDTAILHLPAGWQRQPPHEFDHGREALRISTPDGTRIRIERQRNGAKGRSFIRYRSGEFPTGDSCSLSHGDVGVIWTFYAPDPNVRNDPLPYTAFADFITPSGRWYHVAAHSKTPDQRATVARVVTAIFFGQAE